MITRYPPRTPVEIIDVGDGTGAYSFWLAGRGHSVHFVDVVPRHIATSRRTIDGATWPR